MNKEEIDKWLDNEYGCSYTRLEELHDFYFEKYCDLNKENKQLKDNWNKLKEWVKEDNICFETGFYMGRCVNYQCVLDKMQELEKGEE